MSSTRTPWFPADVKPARPGVYEVVRRPGERLNYPALFRFWDGARWHVASWDVKQARRIEISAPFPRSWRGLPYHEARRQWGTARQAMPV